MLRKSTLLNHGYHLQRNWQTERDHLFKGPFSFNMTVMYDKIPASDEIVRHSECRNFTLTMAGRLGLPLEEPVQSPNLHELDPHVTTWHWAASFRWPMVG